MTLPIQLTSCIVGAKITCGNLKGNIVAIYVNTQLYAATRYVILLENGMTTTLSDGEFIVVLDDYLKNSLQ